MFCSVILKFIPSCFRGIITLQICCCQFQPASVIFDALTEPFHKLQKRQVHIFCGVYIFITEHLTAKHVHLIQNLILFSFHTVTYTSLDLFCVFLLALYGIYCVHCLKNHQVSTLLCPQQGKMTDTGYLSVNLHLLSSP